MLDPRLNNAADRFADAYCTVRRTVVRFGRFRKRWAVLGAWSRAVIVAGGLLILWFLADWQIGMPPWLLLGTFGLVAIVGVVMLVGWVIRPLLRRVRPEHEAVTIELLHGSLDSSLIGSLQLGDEVQRTEPSLDGRARSKLGYSIAMVQALVVRTAERLRSMNPKRLVDLRDTRRWLAAAVLLIAVMIAAAVYAPAAIVERAQRLETAYGWLLDRLFPVEFLVTPGDTAVVRGRPITLAAEVRGARSDRVTLGIEPLATQADDASSQTPPESTDADADQPSRKSIPLLLDADRHATHDLTAERSFRYWFEYAGHRSERFTMRVGDLPRLRAVNFELVFPGYTGRSPQVLVGRLPKLHALPGTNVLVSFAATTELDPRRCSVTWRDGSRQPLSISGRYGHFAFAVERPERATVELCGSLGAGFEMPDPLRFEIVPERDEAPTIRLLRRDRKVKLVADAAAKLAVPWLATDDYGVSAVDLHYKIDTIDPLLERPQRSGTVPRLIEPPQERVKGMFTDVFADLSPPLEPGDRVTLHLTIRDNNTETGPGSGRSAPLEVVVVRPGLGRFVEKEFTFDDRQALLRGLKRVDRATNLLVQPPAATRTEVEQPIERIDVDAQVNQESWPRGAEDAVSNYFRLLSGEE
jgi:hypothetical protein